MSIVTHNRISGVVCRFSTGKEAPYYGRVEEWFYPLKHALRAVNVVLMSECPVFPQDEGDGFLRLNNGHEDMHVFYVWFKMPSGNWEIVCYLT